MQDRTWLWPNLQCKANGRIKQKQQTKLLMATRVIGHAHTRQEVHSLGGRSTLDGRTSLQELRSSTGKEAVCFFQILLCLLNEARGRKCILQYVCIDPPVMICKKPFTPERRPQRSNSPRCALCSRQHSVVTLWRRCAIALNAIRRCLFWTSSKHGVHAITGKFDIRISRRPHGALTGFLKTAQTLWHCRPSASVLRRQRRQMLTYFMNSVSMGNYALLTHNAHQLVDAIWN